MDVTPEEADFLARHKWAVLSTGRRDGSPQSSLIGYHWDGADAVITFPRASAKYKNVVRQPRVVLLVPDGRTAVTVYGDGELVEQDPARVDDYAKILASFGAPETPREELVRSLDTEDRTILRIHPTTVFLNT
jgi:PPOX class probable F420-dependent enzyme